MNLNPGTIVWAKLRGYPFWPSIVAISSSSGLHKKGSGSSSKYFVQFLGGDWDPIWISNSNLRHLQVEDVSPVLQERYRAVRKWEPTYSEAIRIVLSKLTDESENNRLQELNECEIDHHMDDYDTTGDFADTGGMKGNPLIGEGSCPVSQALGMMPRGMNHVAGRNMMGSGDGMTRGSQYEGLGRDEDGKLASISDSSGRGDVLSDISMDEIDGVTFVSCSSMEQLENIEQSKNKKLQIGRNPNHQSMDHRTMQSRFGGVPPMRVLGGLKAQPISDDDNGSGDTSAPPAPENLPAPSNQPAFDVPGKIEIPLPPLHAAHDKDKCGSVLSSFLPPGKNNVHLEMREDGNELKRESGKAKIDMRNFWIWENQNNCDSDSVVEEKAEKGKNEKIANAPQRKAERAGKKAEKDAEKEAKKAAKGEKGDIKEEGDGKLKQTKLNFQKEKGSPKLKKNNGRNPWSGDDREDEGSGSGSDIEMEAPVAPWEKAGGRAAAAKAKYNFDEDSNSNKGDSDEEDMFDNAKKENGSHLEKKKGSNEKEIYSKKKLKAGPPPLANKCEYDSVIEANIAEKKAMFEKLGFPSLKRKIVQDYEMSKKKKVSWSDEISHLEKKESDSKEKKMKNTVDYERMRRSSRDKKKVNYAEPCWDSSFMKKDNGKKARFTNENGEATASSISAEPNRKSTRPKKDAQYNFDMPPDDAYLFCDTCGEDKLHGCEEHPLIFDYIPKLEIGPSRAGKDSGRGIYNVDRNGIPKGVMLGPYKGKVYSPKNYELMKKKKGESGNAWELRNPETGKVNGFIDPGHNPDPEKDWMPMVNCASKEFHQNAVACQYLGNMYYRTVRVIKFREEFLVFYGDDYAKEINIDVTKRNLFELAENWEEKGVICPYCGDGFTTDEYLDAHIGGDESVVGCVVLKVDKNRTDVEEGLKPHICNTCGMAFERKRDLERHKRVHQVMVKPFSCTQCDKAYTTLGILNVHVRRAHTDDERGHCPNCEKLFSTMKGLKEHMKTNCNQEKPYKCVQCGYKTSFKTYLNQHIQVVHNRQFLFNCQICDERFGWKAGLNKHIKYAHTEDRPYKCEFCDKAFKFSQDLKEHRIRMHTKEWPLLCILCMDLGIEKGFIQLDLLDKHYQLKHPVEYQEDLKRKNVASCPCPKCTKRFPNEDQVKIHMSKFHD